MASCFIFGERSNYTKWIFCIVRGTQNGVGVIEIQPTKLHIYTLLQNSIFCTISLIISALIRVPIVPLLPFLKLEISDAPMFVCALVSDMPSAVLTLLVATTIRTIFLSSAGWPGFIFRMTSVIMIFFLSLSKKNSNAVYKILCVLFGILIYISAKIPINYFLWINIFGMPKQFLDNLLFTTIVPFNVIKCVLNCILAFVLVKPTKNILYAVKKKI